MEFYGSPKLTQVGSLGSPKPLIDMKAAGPKAKIAAVRKLEPTLICVRGARPKDGMAKGRSFKGMILKYKYSFTRYRLTFGICISHQSFAVVKQIVSLSSTPVCIFLKEQMDSRS